MNHEIKLEWEAIKKLVDIKKNLIEKISILLHDTENYPANRAKLVLLLLKATREEIRESDQSNNTNFQSKSLELLFNQLQINLISLDNFYSKRKDGIITKALKSLVGKSGDSNINLIEKVNQVYDKAQNQLQQVGETNVQSNQKLDEIKDVESSIQEVHKSVEETKQAINNKATETDSFLNTTISEVESKKKDIEIFTNKGDELFQKAEKTQQQIQEQSEEIKYILAGANQAGMAGSFIKRAEQLRRPMIFYLTSSIISALAIVYIGYSIFGELNENAIWYHLILQRIFTISPLIYLTWFFTERYNRLALLKEKYTFKYTTAMAFEGYKKQVEDSKTEGDKLLSDLLRISIDVFSDDPTKEKIEDSTLKFLDNKSELLDKIISVVKKIKDP